MKEQNNILIDSTNKTPQVDFNSLTGDLILHGKSIPENASKLYEPIYNWVVDYSKDPKPTTNLRLNLDYFNTASSLWIAKIIKCLSRINHPEYILFIHLYFDVEDYDDMGTEDVKDALSPVIDVISTATVSIGVKIYGIDEKGEIIKESMVLI